MNGDGIEAGQPTLSTELREQGYSVREAADAMSVSKSAMDKWVRKSEL